MPVDGKKSNSAKQNRGIIYISNIINQLLVTAEDLKKMFKGSLKKDVLIHMETHSKLSPK